MNITKELGSLISGLLAPQGASPAKGVAKGQQSDPRTAKGHRTAKNGPAQGKQGVDRLTLSSASRDLLAASQKQPQRPKVSPATESRHQPQLLALPYLPTLPATDDRNTADHSLASGAAEQATMVAETPATRQLVRDTYGDSSLVSATASLPGTRKIDFHA